MTDIEHVLAVQNEAGECPRWDVGEQALTWADIVDPHLYRYTPATGELKRARCDVHVTGIGLRAGGGLVVASKTGLYLFDRAFHKHRFITDPEAARPSVRFNDGMVDRQGRYWAGTLNEADFTDPSGSLYRLDPDGSLHTMDTGLNVPNGIGWSPDDTTLYLVDSLPQVIYAYDFDAASGSISNRRVLVEVPREAGMPDGLTVDAEGGIWIGHWGGWTVTRYDPAGRLQADIRLPVANVTAPMFGGAYLDEMYITTAWFLLSADERRQQPLAGDLFRIRPGVRGLPEPKFAG